MTLQHSSDDRDERLLHRLESFSDIVIGFSLAQLALNLTLPGRAIDFVTKPVALIGFVITVFVISTIWWSHMRLFRDYFVPNRLTIVLNFASLGSTIMLVYTLQMVVHFAEGTSHDDFILAVSMLIATMGLTYLLLGVLYAIGLLERWRRLDDVRRARGLQRSLRLCGVGLGGVVGSIIAALSAHSPSNAYVDVTLGVALGSVAANIARRVVIPRLGLKNALRSRAVV